MNQNFVIAASPFQLVNSCEICLRNYGKLLYIGSPLDPKVIEFINELKIDFCYNPIDRKRNKIYKLLKWMHLHLILLKSPSTKVYVGDLNDFFSSYIAFLSATDVHVYGDGANTQFYKNYQYRKFWIVELIARFRNSIVTDYNDYQVGIFDEQSQILFERYNNEIDLVDEVWLMESTTYSEQMKSIEALDDDIKWYYKDFTPYEHSDYLDDLLTVADHCAPQLKKRIFYHRNSSQKLDSQDSQDSDLAFEFRVLIERKFPKVLISMSTSLFTAQRIADTLNLKPELCFLSISDRLDSYYESRGFKKLQPC